MGWWWVDGAALSDPEPSTFMLSCSWYLRDSFSSILGADKEGDAAPGSGETSLGGVGGKVYRCGLVWDGGVKEDAETVLELLLQG